jgi:hypothetical protein
MPKPIDFLPHNPKEGPPLPRGLAQEWPWANPDPPLTPEQQIELERVAGKWAARRSLAMLPATVSPEEARKFAESMFTRMYTRLTAAAPPAPPKAPPKKAPPKPKAPPPPKELTPEQRADLATRLAELITKRPAIREEPETLVSTVIAWAESFYKVTPPREVATDIIKDALEMAG